MRARESCSGVVAVPSSRPGKGVGSPGGSAISLCGSSCCVRALLLHPPALPALETFPCSCPGGSWIAPRFCSKQPVQGPVQFNSCVTLRRNVPSRAVPLGDFVRQLFSPRCKIVVILVNTNIYPGFRLEWRRSKSHSNTSLISSLMFC